MAHAHPAQDRTLERARVTRYLDGLIDEHQTVLVTPPPGSGKHVALKHWARGSRRPVAWLHAVDSMAHQPTFLDALISSLRLLYPRLSPRAVCHRCRVQSLADAILEHIAEPLHDDNMPAVLILDGLHILNDDALVDGIIALIRFAPPGLTLVLVYRGLLPLRLAHMRTALCEADPAVFRLTHDELGALTQHHGVELSDLDSAIALRLTSWMSSANLLCMAVTLGAHPTDLLKRGRRHGANIDVWLVHQVVIRLPLSTRRLLALAVVHGTVEHPMSDSSTYDADVQIIEELGLIWTGDDGRFTLPRHYRSCLRELDQSVDIFAHRTAAAYLLHTDNADAFQHALTAQDPSLAGDTIARSGLTLSFDGQVDRVGAWLLRLPSEVRFERIDVGLVSLCCTALRGRTEEMEQHMPLFRRARQMQPEQLHLGEQCLLQLISGWHAQHQDRWGDALGHSYHALRLATESRQIPGVHAPVLPDLHMRATRLKADALHGLGCHDESIRVLRGLIRLASDAPHRGLLARARVAMVMRSQGRSERALDAATEVIDDADVAGLHNTHATGFARYVRSLVYLDRYEPYKMIEEAERAWTECFSAIHAHDRLCVERTLHRMRRATDMLQRPPPVPLFDVSTIAELSPDDLELMNRYAYGLNHWEVSRTMGVHSADVRRRTLQIRRQLGATSRTEAVQMLRAAGRVTHYPSLTMY